MQREFLGSALVHGAIVAAALVWIAYPPQEDAPAMGSVTVDIIASSVVTSNATESIDSDATEDLVLSGSQATISATSDSTRIEPLDTEVVVPVETSRDLTVETSELLPSVQPSELLPVAEPIDVVEVSDATPTEVLTSAALAADDLSSIVSPSLEPVQSSERPQAVAPVMPVPRPSDLSVAKPAPPPAPRATTQQSGNGGNSEQDSAAARSASGQSGTGFGGGADEARYPGQVERKVARALRYPSDARGARGEVQVNFTLDASGNVVRLTIGRSSGDAVLDQAALDTVQRAAPFPAFPAGSARGSWDFSIPLAFAKD